MMPFPALTLQSAIAEGGLAESVNRARQKTRLEPFSLAEHAARASFHKKLAQRSSSERPVHAAFRDRLTRITKLCDRALGAMRTLAGIGPDFPAQVGGFTLPGLTRAARGGWW
jgi:hypothetical protein